MTSLGTLPYELVKSVVQHLQDRKIDSFDVVANHDLQNVRLVCKTVRGSIKFTAYHFVQAKQYLTDLNTVTAPFHRNS